MGAAAGLDIGLRIPYYDQPQVLQRYGSPLVYDEAASKTVNLAQDTTTNDIYAIFMEAYTMGLKNIAVYRDKSRTAQPEQL